LQIRDIATLRHVQENSWFGTVYNDKCELEKGVLFNDVLSGYHYVAFVADKQNLIVEQWC
jgi:hypothetical protein